MLTSPQKLPNPKASSLQSAPRWRCVSPTIAQGGSGLDLAVRRLLVRFEEKFLIIECKHWVSAEEVMKPPHLKVFNT